MAHLWRCAQSPLVSFLQKDFFPILSRLKFLMNFGPKNESNLKKVERLKTFFAVPLEENNFNSSS